jgi:DNA-binding NarL/FixJ family response regulator
MPIKILVVDDHALTRRGIMALLKDHDPTWQLEEAEDGIMAAIKAGNQKPDIILLDYHMPKLNGGKAATLIRKASPGSRLILVTMEMSPEVMIDTINAGVVGIVSKHSGENELISAIDHVQNGKNHFPEGVSEIVAMDDLEKQKRIKKSRHTTSKLLTDRENEVFQFVIKGLPASSIARILSISIRTVTNHKANIFKKCKVSSTPELIRFAIKKKIGVLMQ